MGNDQSGVVIRERVWVEIIDHEQSPPQIVKRVFFENGEVKAIEDLSSAEQLPLFGEDDDATSC